MNKKTEILKFISDHALHPGAESDEVGELDYFESAINAKNRKKHFLWFQQ